MYLCYDKIHFPTTLTLLMINQNQYSLDLLKTMYIIKDHMNIVLIVINCPGVICCRVLVLVNFTGPVVTFVLVLLLKTLH